MNNEGCTHEWRYQGLIYSSGDRKWGSDACEQVYEDRYYCIKCLEVKDINRRINGNTYGKPVEGAMPK